MSDSEGHRIDETAPADKPWKKDTRNVPPLVWVIVVALLAVIVVGFLYSRGPSTPKAADQPAAAAEPAAAPAAS